MAVRRLLVASLFRDPRSLLIGATTAVVAMLVTTARTGSWSIAFCALGVALVTWARLATMKRYWADPRAGADDASILGWEIAYGAGAATHALALGVWALLCLTETQDGFAQLLSSVVTIACASAIPGRNFGRVAIATAQIAALCIPLSVGWMAQGDPYYLFLIVTLLPFFLALRIMSQRLQGILLEALTANDQVGVLAARFDAAVTHMPHGLCMVDATQRILVANPRFDTLLGIGRRAGASTGLSLSDVLRAATGFRKPGARAGADLCADLLSRGQKGIVPFDLSGGRFAVLTLEPLADGGAVVLVEDVTERRIAEDRINHLARFDTLTDTMNRTFFLEQMIAHLARTPMGALLFIDLDQFKPVNDTLGHACGDQVLREVARRFAAAIGPGDLLGRFGGDEFVVLQGSASNRADAEELASKLLAAAVEPFSVPNGIVKISTSIGIAMAPEDGSSADLLIERADLAVYRSKQVSRGTWSFFDPGMDLAVRARQTLEKDLRAAVAEDQFVAFYQPLVRLSDGAVSGCEALVRWHHPERGLIAPGDFIAVAEDLGLIVDIGARVLDVACRDCLLWPASRSVAVNLSAVQFQQGDIVDTIARALARSGLPPERLEVEITETILLQDTDEVRDTLKRINALGVTIALDDFGVGYSSLSYLHKFPLHKVKLDRSFLDDVHSNPRASVVLGGICKLVRQLGLRLLIEGVETEDQLELLRSFPEIDDAQGFVFSRPVPQDRTLELFATLEKGEGPSVPVFGVAQSSAEWPTAAIVPQEIRERTDLVGAG